MTTLENKVAKYAKNNHMDTNSTAWHVMENAVCSAIEQVEAFTFIDMTQYHAILDDATKGIKNPENWAVRSCISDDLKLLGWSFVSNGVAKN